MKTNNTIPATIECPEGVTTELCPHCGAEVELRAEFVVQKCPECGEAILPCSICPTLGQENACVNCPLERKSFDANEHSQEELIILEFAGHFVHATEKQIAAAMLEVDMGWSSTTAEAVAEVLATFKDATTVVEIKNPLESFTVRELLDEIRRRALQEEVIDNLHSLNLMSSEKAQWETKTQLHACCGVEVGAFNDNYYVDPEEYKGESDMNNLIEKSKKFGIGLIVID